ncbi:cytochrome P450 [Streptomyces sp. NBC_00237]|uniref:cytochrome P450 n=1 Tax=Streptomyces sp. NBC_00237 TaxID=2975687 RepID=UPI002250E3D3|nr:cytochrome P450 [Streptomyces sp. NBC_00237]MCX5201132.1 cytochrome P450 [Streptomyces sp. NBC_00237]
MTTSVQYNPLDAATLADPYRVYAELRSTTPIFWHDQMECWVLTRYKDCQSVLLNPEVFATDWRRAGETVAEPWLSLQTLDPPEHAPLRSLFMNALRGRDLNAIGARGEALVDSALDNLGDKAEFDLIPEVIAPLALATISDLLGIQCPELSTFSNISDTIVRSMDASLEPDDKTRAELRKQGIEARAQLSSLVESWFEADPNPGMLADVTSKRDSVAVPDHFVRNTVRVVFQSGYSSIVSGAGNAMLALLQHPESVEKLRDPELFATGFDELMRYDCSVQGTSRMATRSTTIGDTAIERGDVVLVLFGAANRDPAQFPRPDELLLDRKPNQHMAFGRGPHTCVGNLFTQVTLQALIKSVLRRSTPLRLAAEPVRRRTATMRYLDTLPVTFSAENPTEQTAR